MPGIAAGPETRITIMRDWIARLCLLLMTGPMLSLPALAQDAQGTPTAVVQRLNDALLDVMKEADTLGLSGRYDRLEPVLNDLFAFSTMTRVAAGGHWRTLAPEQRDGLTDAFARFSIATYANRFNGFTGEQFEIDSEEAAARGSMLVRSRIITGDGEVVRLDYLLRANSGTWRIFDIYLDGTISELATRRSEYTSILDSDGYDGLMMRLEGRISDLKAESG